VLGLFAAVTLAGDLPPPDATAKTTSLEEDVVMKNRNACPTGTTFFKNAFPALTNGTDGGCKTVEFPVGDEIVPMTVCWGPRLDPDPDIALPDNSFEFSLEGGVLHRAGVSVDTNDWIYNFMTPVADDRVLNSYSDGTAAGDVAHLDLCMESVDTDAPEVGIRVEPSSDGTTVSGTISIIATVKDESPLDDDDPVTFKLLGLDDGIDYTSEIQGPPSSSACGPGCTEYTWTLETTRIPEGEYEVSVRATDSSILANSFEVKKNITVVRILQDCLEGDDGVPTGTTSLGGCNFTGYLQLEYPELLRNYPDLSSLPVTQGAIPAFTSEQNATCGLSTNGPFEFIAKDPRVDDAGNVFLDMPQDLSLLFNIADHYLEFHPGELVPQVWLRADTVGSPCLALIHQDAPEFSELTLALPNGGVYTVTQYPELVPGMYDGLARITAPLSDSQPDLQFVEQAANQTDDLLLLIERAASPFTSDVFNASRTRGFKGTFFPLNTREVCLFLDPALDPSYGAPYFEAVLQCKTDLAVEYFDSLEQALIEAEPNLISPSLNTLLTDVNKARSMVKVGRWNKATVDLSALFREVTNATWNIDYRNDPGNLIMRIDNLFFRIEQLELAEDNLP